MTQRRMQRWTIGVLLAAAAALALGGLARAADDKLAFVPKGGVLLLLEVKAKCGNCDDLATLVTVKRSADDWLKYFTGRQSTATGLSEAEKKKGALATFTDRQIKTLVTYLSINMPMPKDRVPKDPARAKWDTVLPVDGRKLTLDKCMGCHSLATTLLIEGDVPAWGVVMRKSDHANLVNAQELQELLHYLAINMPVPDDQIPDEFRKGGIGY